MWKKRIQPGEKVPLKLTASERKLILEGLTCLDQNYEEMVRSTPSGKPMMLTLDDLEDFGGFIAAEANHCDDRGKQKKLDAIFDKIQTLQDGHTEEGGSPSASNGPAARLPRRGSTASTRRRSRAGPKAHPAAMKRTRPWSLLLCSQE
jgi:hypothetical protein